MAQNVLITGGAGFIGGSLIADILSNKAGVFKAAKYFAAVRSQEQVESLSKLGVNVIQLELTDKTAVEEAILQNEINIVVHTAGAIDSRMVSSFIDALGQRQKQSGNKTYYLYTSVASMFSKEGGWPYGEVKDTDSIIPKEKAIQQPHPVRDNNILVAESGKAQNVTTYNIAVPMVYGRGKGEWRKLSVSIPAFARTSMKLKTVYKFDKEGSPPAVHIDDLVALYMLILGNVLTGSPSIPSGEEGHYFAMAHRSPWWKVMDGLAKGLHARGLVSNAEVQTWPSNEMAAENLGFPLRYLNAICTASGELVPVNGYKIGWKPQWDEERFLSSLDDEVQAVQELDTIKMSLFDAFSTQ